MVYGDRDQATHQGYAIQTKGNITMNLKVIIEKLQLQVLTEPIDDTSISPTTGYSSDLLSCVMTGARAGAIWVTLQSHLNIVAVAGLLDLSAVIITENARPDRATIAKANEVGVILLGCEKSSYEVCGLLWELGLRS